MTGVKDGLVQREMSYTASLFRGWDTTSSPRTPEKCKPLARAPLHASFTNSSASSRSSFRAPCSLQQAFVVMSALAKLITTRWTHTHRGLFVRISLQHGAHICDAVPRHFLNSGTRRPNSLFARASCASLSCDNPKSQAQPCPERHIRSKLSNMSCLAFSAMHPTQTNLSYHLKSAV